MNRLLQIILTLAFCISGLNVFAQLVMDTTHTPEQLVQYLLGPGVSVSNVTYTGNPNALGSFDNGYTTNLGLDEGVTLSSGYVMPIPNPATVFLSHNCGSPGDPDLDTYLTGFLSTDAAVLEFDFIPDYEYIQFQYVFGSEEYPEYVGTSFTDIFGFFINGPDPAGGAYVSENVALVPGTDEPVMINTVNQNYNSQYYIDNTNGTSIAYDAFTTVLQSLLHVVPFESYHIKLAVGDCSDFIYDSGVFLEANSFMSVGIEDDLPEIDKVEISYSPNGETIRIQGVDSQISTIHVMVYSVSGKVVLDDMIRNGESISFADFKSGMYIVQIVDGTISHSAKIMK